MRTEPVLGNQKNILGTDKADLVLETLGKVYIKQGKSLKDLTKLLKQIDTKSAKVLNNEESVIIVDSISNLQYPGDGKFIFSSSDKTLYITFEGQLVPLIDARNYGTDDHVLKKGDDMLGTLNFKVPFTIRSSSLIDNLNSNFLNGYRDTDFAKKSENEIISGNWTFTGNNESTNKFTFKDVVINNTIGTFAFQGGYTGYGWQLDSKTNTLTIDNLIVRKLLSVYELVVNQIRATNGTLWVTNSATVDDTSNLYVEDSESAILLNSLYPNSYYLYYTSVIYTYQYFSNDRLNSYIEDEQFAGDKLQFILDYNNVYNLGVNIYDISSEITRIKLAKMFIYIDNVLTEINLYDKYFNSGNYFIATFKDYPLFQSADIVRCQKFEGNRVRYYDALIIALLKDNTYLIQLSPQFNDLYTDIESGTNKPNSIAYNKTEENLDNPKTVLGRINIGDDIVQIGNLYDTSRQGSVYITSTDDNGPYLEVLDGVNRPDFSVLYETPTFYTYKHSTLNVDCYISKDKPALDLGSDTFYIKNNELYKVNEGETVEDSFIGYYNTAPTIDCLVKSKQFTSPMKTRLGNLKGVYDTKFDISGYGLYSQNVFLTGDFYLNNGKSVVEFTQEQILLQFGNAGITIKDDSIFMDAEKINIQLGDTNMQLFSTENGVIKINTDMLDIEGYLSANGIYVYPEGTEPDPTNPELGASSYMSADGRFYTNYGKIDNCYIGGNSDTVSIAVLKTYISVIENNMNEDNYNIPIYADYKYYNPSTNYKLSNVFKVTRTSIPNASVMNKRYSITVELDSYLNTLDDNTQIKVFWKGYELGTYSININSASLQCGLYNNYIRVSDGYNGYAIQLGGPGLTQKEEIKVAMSIVLDSKDYSNGSGGYFVSSNTALLIENNYIQDTYSYNYSIVANSTIVVPNCIEYLCPDVSLFNPFKYTQYSVEGGILETNRLTINLPSSIDLKKYLEYSNISLRFSTNKHAMIPITIFRGDSHIVIHDSINNTNVYFGGNSPDGSYRYSEKEIIYLGVCINGKNEFNYKWLDDYSQKQIL